MNKKRFTSATPLKAKKSLGQNFLVDTQYVDRIIDAVDPSDHDHILEIGPGHGAITERLAASGAAVVALELDQRLIEPLREKFVGYKRLRIVEQDALNANLKELISETGDTDAEGKLRKAKLVANLPYYISTAILRRLAEQREFFSSLVLMFQREVVDRITAKPGNSERGYLTVLTETAFEIEKLFDISPAAFRPVPKVWSAVVRLTPKEKQPQEEKLKTLLSAAFAQKRKTISNNLKAVYSNYQSALVRSDIDPRSRAEDLSLEDWLRLCDAISPAI